MVQRDREGKCVRGSRRVKSGALRDEPFDIWEDPEKTSCLWVNYCSPLQLINTFLISHIKRATINFCNSLRSMLAPVWSARVFHCNLISFKTLHSVYRLIIDTSRSSLLPLNQRETKHVLTGGRLFCSVAASPLCPFSGVHLALTESVHPSPSIFTVLFVTAEVTCSVYSPLLSLRCPVCSSFCAVYL